MDSIKKIPNALTKKQLILFDLDGVLIDSKRNMEIAWSEVCKIHQLAVNFEDYFSNIGRPFKDILDILNIKKNQSGIEQTFNDISTQFLNEVNYYTGVEATLEYLVKKDIKTGIVTSKNTVKTNKILDLISFDFDIVQTPNSTLQGKPEPDHIIYAMSMLNIDLKHTLYIGDMKVDYLAAKGANIDYMHAGWGYGAPLNERVTVLNSITELMNYF